MPIPGRSLLAFLVLLAIPTTFFAASIEAQPAPGIQEDFPGFSTSTWGGGSTFSNPGTGGLGGDGDGYLDVSNSFGGNLGTFSDGASYAGDWTTSGVTQVRVWLKDTGGTGNLEIHFGLGNQGNFWQYNVGFVPSTEDWAPFMVDLTQSANFTQIHGLGTYAQALATVDRILFRHDLAPYVSSPDGIAGGFGIDHLLLTDGSVGVEPGIGVARPVLLAAPYPNPARGRVTFSVQGADARPVTLRIYDTAGRLVRHADLAAAAGPRVWLWDGLGDDGVAAAPGVYRARATGAGGGSSRTFTLLR